MLTYISTQTFEVAAMKFVKASLPSDAVVTVPTIHHFDEVANVVIMEDCGTGARTLKQLMLDEPPSLPVAIAIGAGLGEFLGRLHSRRLNPQAANHEFFDTNQQAKMLSGFATYGRLVTTLTDKDDIPALSDPPLDIDQSKLDIISSIAAHKIHAINTSHQTLTMGDFWPGNFMICLGPTTGDNPQSLQRVYVLDWELAKPGVAGLDVGQFCAEMHQLRRFSPTCHEPVTALNAFLKSYRNGFGADTVEIAKDAVVHIGAHLVAWTPRVPWGGKECTREVVVEGVDYLVEGYSGNQEWLGRSLVRPLL